MGEAIFWGTLAAAVLLNRWPVLLLAPAGIFLVGLVLARVSALKPIEKEAVAKTRRAIGYELAIGIVLVVAVALVLAP